jgi:LAS superfamily LD-carboxypeptidase LdcB
MARVTAKALEERIAALEATSTLLYGLLASTTEENANLSAQLGIAVSDNTELSRRVVASENHIEILDKLRSLDKELLQKYSKVYFLNENYVPSALATVTPEYSFDGKKPLRIHSEVLPFLDKLMEAASTTGNPLALISAYRSFKDQAVLKNQYTVTYGKGANSFSADQGYSEHQLGTTIDFTTPGLGANYTNLDRTEAYKWLLENGWKYGFVQSYPKNNSYYIYEPWHWRFVGVVLSSTLHQQGKNFYDMDQRDIDGYLIDIFSPI